jgi:hypothetical protein
MTDSIKLCCGIEVSGATNREAAFIKGRDKFISEWCKNKGLDPNNLDILQIMEIRKQDGWKNPAI